MTDNRDIVDILKDFDFKEVGAIHNTEAAEEMIEDAWGAIVRLRSLETMLQEYVQRQDKKIEALEAHNDMLIRTLHRVTG